MSNPLGIGGKQPFYKTAEEMLKVINDYFESCWEEDYLILAQINF